MTADILIQNILDGLLLSLCSLGLLGRAKGKLDILHPILLAGVCLLTRKTFGYSTAVLAYAVLPVHAVTPFLFFFLAVLLINGLWFPRREGHVFFGTIAAFALYLLLRELCLVAFNLLGVEEAVWYIYISRALSLLMWLTFWAIGLLRWIKERLIDGDIPVRILVSNTAVLLLLVLIMFQFDLSLMFQWLPVTAGVLVLIIFGDSVTVLIEQRRIQSERRTLLVEQYLPLVEELIEQVRARQHEYSNQMMAISAMLAAANDLDKARADVAALLHHAKFAGTDRELLKCDSKVIGGMLYGKVKQAEFKHIRIHVTIAGSFLHRSLSEADWVEIIGILMDNAIEASTSGDVIYARAIEENNDLLFTVSNPHSALSNMEFVQMFRRGWTTKTTGGHGYGLFNVRTAIERCHGKIIARNETIDETQHITVGVLVS